MTEGSKNWAGAAIGLGGTMLGAMAYMMGGLGRDKEPTVKELKSEKEHLERSHVIANRALTNSAVVLSTIMDAAAEGANELRKERLVIDTLKEEKRSLESEVEVAMSRVADLEKKLSAAQARLSETEELLRAIRSTQKAPTGPTGPVGSGG
jgi:chromosome segregation ATPase